MWAWWAMPLSSRARCRGSISQSEARTRALNQWEDRQLSSLISGISSPAGNGFTVATFYAALKQGAVNSRWQQVPLALIGGISMCRALIGQEISTVQCPLSKPKQWYVTKAQWPSSFCEKCPLNIIKKQINWSFLHLHSALMKNCSLWDKQDIVDANKIFHLIQVSEVGLNVNMVR